MPVGTTPHSDVSPKRTRLSPAVCRVGSVCALKGHMKKIKLLVFSILIIVALISGEFIYIHATNCLPPRIFSVPDSIGEPDSIRFSLGSIPTMILGVPSWWELQPKSTSLFESEEHYLSVADTVATDEEIWLARGREGILRYNNQTGEHKYYSIQDERNEPFRNIDILLSENGTLWVLMESINKMGYVALARYNPIKDTFEVITDKSSILQQREMQDNAANYVDSQVLAETDDGKIIMPFAGRLLVYDPMTNMAEYLLPEDFVTPQLNRYYPITAIAISENQVWFTVAKDMDLRSLNLETRELKNYGHAQSILDDPNWRSLDMSYRPIAIDGRGRVWMGYFTRLVKDEDGNYSWEQISLPPHFVNRDIERNAYVWGRLRSIYTSSDGDLWFNTPVGLIKYDVDTDSWCNSMPVEEFFIVTEDENNTLWLVLGDKKWLTLGRYSAGIYKYPLQP